MQQTPLAYLNGEFIPFDQLKLPVYDLGIVQGATVTERLRTFSHQPHLLNEHLQRLCSSAVAIGLAEAVVAPIRDVVQKLIETNANIEDAPTEFSVVIFITAGSLINDANGLIDASTPTVCVYTAPLPIDRYHNGYQTGVALLTSKVKQIPASCIPPQVKMRSRLHWYLAEQEVKQRDPNAMALLLDEHDSLTETSSGNLFLVKDGTLFTPLASSTLNGIAQSYVSKLAKELKLEVVRKPLDISQINDCEEFFLTASTYCIMPIRSINGIAPQLAIPGPITQSLSAAWSAAVGTDFRTQ